MVTSSYVADQLFECERVTRARLRGIGEDSISSIYLATEPDTHNQLCVTCVCYSHVCHSVCVCVCVFVFVLSIDW